MGVVGIAIQTIMAPLNLIENPLIEALIRRSGLQQEAKIFDQKSAIELAHDDEIVNESGNPVTIDDESFEDLLLNTWDLGIETNVGMEANVEKLMTSITRQNCNYQTRENRWSRHQS